MSIPNDIASTKIYNKRDDFCFEIVNFPFSDGDVPRSTSHGVYICQVGLKSLFRQGLLEPEFYGDLLYKLKKIVGSDNFSEQSI